MRCGSSERGSPALTGEGIAAALGRPGRSEERRAPAVRTRKANERRRGGPHARRDGTLKAMSTPPPNTPNDQPRNPQQQAQPQSPASNPQQGQHQGPPTPGRYSGQHPGAQYPSAPGAHQSGGGNPGGMNPHRGSLEFMGVYGGAPGFTGRKLNRSRPQ